MNFSPSSSQTHPAFIAAADAIADVGRRLHARGWSPATSSNYSLRLDTDSCAITVSGRDKGTLRREDVMRVDMQGRALDAARPSAETLLHTALYRRDASIGAVLHTHSMFATLVSMHADETVVFEGLELLKAFSGVATHDGVLRVPVFDNSQDIAALAAAVDAYMDVAGTGHAYLIRGHGIYTWGEDMPAAMRQLEALEFLLEYTWRKQGVSR